METRRFELTLEPNEGASGGTCVKVDYYGKNLVIDTLVAMHALIAHASAETGENPLVLLDAFESGFRKHLEMEEK